MPSGIWFTDRAAAWDGQDYRSASHLCGSLAIVMFFLYTRYIACIAYRASDLRMAAGSIAICLQALFPLPRVCNASFAAVPAWVYMNNTADDDERPVPQLPYRVGLLADIACHLAVATVAVHTIRGSGALPYTAFARYVLASGLYGF